MTDIKSMNIEELTEYVCAAGFPRFRAKQLYQWMHKNLACSFDEMNNIPKEMKTWLNENCRYVCLEAEVIKRSQLDGTVKYLFSLGDGNYIESVLMRYRHGNSVCISSQVGCRMGCRFCASTIDGCVRGLTPSEMLDQIYRISRECGERIDNVVVMGSGEPFDNYEALIKFIELLKAPDGLNISARNLTVSTCGLVPYIYALADTKPQLTLAISLHAPDEELRKTLMPIANKYSVREIIEACRYFIEKTGRRITFEYSLVSGVNDTAECADKLIALLKGLNCHVNLIPVNPIKERDFKQSRQNDILNFKNRLERGGINVTVRRELGRDIDGSCGQLRRHYAESNTRQFEEIKADTIK